MKFSGARLKQARLLGAHMTQQEMARTLGVAYRTYQKFEAGVRVPDADVVADVALLCSCSLDSLYDRTPPV